ncbi:MAG: holo-ACP synthase [Patulibacter minatonensis]
MTVLGIGTDVVHVPAFAEQLADPASGFVDHTFTATELAFVQTRPGPRATHLAARFAAKEAFVKAWSSARLGRAPALGEIDLREIEVVADAYARPFFRLHGRVASAVRELVEPDPSTLLLTLSHDGPVATATVLLQRPDSPAGRPSGTSTTASEETP